MTKTEQIQNNEIVANALREYVTRLSAELNTAIAEKDDFKVSETKGRLASLKNKLRKIEVKNAEIAQLSL